MLGNQNLHYDDHGVLRFVENKLITKLIDHFEHEGMKGLNALSYYYQVNNIPTEHYEQITRLIGYSVSGWEGLSTTDDQTWGTVMKHVEEFEDYYKEK
ncbi:hypothetical protein NVP1187O_091 [Vibrio phage 1.187.O._10N.286.49.F1]|nr:hypothetical protein NVP1187O_091 [Vibrio phage 1.187.O._10N.286.49.F1]